MLNDAAAATDAASADSSLKNANGTEEIADNGSMTTDTFTAEQAISIETDPAEAAALSYILNEDTLVQTPNEIHEVLLETSVAESAASPTNDPTPETVEVEAPVEEPEEEAEPAEALPAGPSRIAVCSQTNGRTNNEDSYFVQSLPTAAGTAPAQLLALSDGMGGHDFGEHASQETLRKLALLLFEQFAVMPRLNRGESAPTAEDIGRGMAQAIPLVSGHVQRIAEINGWNRSGATLVAGAVVGNQAVFVNVGDSPAYHVRLRKKRVVPLTDDHSLAGMLLKANLITPEMARVHEGRCQLEHYIGGPNLPNEIPLRMVNLEAGDYLLLCSDGVSNSLTEETILRLLTEGEGDIADRSVGFVVHARQTGEHDNQTIVLYRHGDLAMLPEMALIPDAGPVALQPIEFSDNVPAAEPLAREIVEAQA